jgi:Zinc finger, C2H2 type
MASQDGDLDALPGSHLLSSGNQIGTTVILNNESSAETSMISDIRQDSREHPTALSMTKEKSKTLEDPASQKTIMREARNETLNCNICNAAFKRQDNLNRHMISREFRYNPMGVDLLMG